MDDKTRIENTLKKILRFDFYINSTNTKSSIIIAWNGILIGTILLKFQEILNLYDCHLWSYYFSSTLLVFIGIASVISIVFVFNVIFPFLKEKAAFKNQDDHNDSGSLFFFGTIARMPCEKYIAREKESSEEQILEDVLTQAHILSKGLIEKMNKLRSSIYAIYFQLLLICFLIVLRGILSY